MTRFRYLPAIAPPVDIAAPHDGFIQQVELIDGKLILGRARWHAPPGRDGVVQILDLTIADAERRRGLGGQLIKETIAQAREYLRSRDIRFRRTWISVEQKSQVKARAFLTGHGFHHVSTISNLLTRQDALIYLKAMV